MISCARRKERKKNIENVQQKYVPKSITTTATQRLEEEAPAGRCMYIREADVDVFVRGYNFSAVVIAPALYFMEKWWPSNRIIDYRWCFQHLTLENRLQFIGCFSHQTFLSVIPLIELLLLLHRSPFTRRSHFHIFRSRIVNFFRPQLAREKSLAFKLVRCNFKQR